MNATLALAAASAVLSWPALGAAQAPAAVRPSAAAPAGAAGDAEAGGAAPLRRLARAQSVQSLLDIGFRIVAASGDTASQYLYLQGVDEAKRNVAYACQIQFGASGGFRGCLVLP